MYRQARPGASLAFRLRASCNRAGCRLRPRSERGPTWHNPGTASAKSGRLGGAAAADREAVRLDSADAEGLEDLAAVCHEANDAAGLLAARRQTVDLCPGRPDLGNELLYAPHYAEHDPAGVFRDHLARAARHADPLRSP